jgi:hypothetical protein
MTPTQDIQARVISSVMVLALMFHPFAYAQDPPLPPASGNPTQTQGPASPQPDVADPAARPSAPQPSENQLPDSPGTVQSRPSQQQPDPANGPAAQAPPDSPQSSDQVPGSSDPAQPASNQSNTQPSTQQQPQSPHEPVGTAAAESVQTTGVAASRPAGAAVAPAKQRRARSILIKVGALVGVGVAVGTTMALSQGSPSRPPGSH